MRKLHLSLPGQPLQLIQAEVQRPQPSANEVLVRVHAAGIIPSELLWYPTTHGKNGEPRIHAVPAHEFSGTVAALGPEATGFAIGDEVYGMNDWFSDGALADYCLTIPASIAAKPPRLTHSEAASVPIGALTAWQGLFVRAALNPGEEVLVHAAAGGVGVYAVQLAHLRGARVTATTSAKNRDFVLRLGAHQIIDYQKECFEDLGQKFDVVFDAVGGETLTRSFAVLKPGGRLVTVAASSEPASDARVKEAFFIVEPNHQWLTELAALIQQGKINPVVDAVVPFADATLAYTGAVTKRQGRGRLVVSVSD
jgi:NADPH:quinone reductase-like Zn-dependent oxidoreductase